MIEPEYNKVYVSPEYGRWEYRGIVALSIYLNEIYFIDDDELDLWENDQFSKLLEDSTEEMDSIENESIQE